MFEGRGNDTVVVVFEHLCHTDEVLSLGVRIADATDELVDLVEGRLS